MPFIPMNLNEIAESRPVPNGKYDLVITAAEETKTKEKGTPQFRVSIGILGHDNSPNLTHFIPIPSEMDEPKTAQFKGLLLRRFCELFGIDLDPAGFDTTKLAMSMVGEKASAELTIDESGDYNRLNVPKVKDEPTPAARSAPKPPKR